MRVAVVTQYFPNSVQRWAGHSAYQTLRVLAKQCNLKVFYPDATYPAMLRPKSRMHDELDPNFEPEGVPATYLKYPVFPLISRPVNGWMMSRKLLPAVREYKPDVILNYVVYPDGYAAVRIGRELGVPVVLTAIGSDLNRISDRLSGVFTRQALREASFTTTVSRDLLATARKLGADPQRSCAILNGCDTDIFRPRDLQQARSELGLEKEAQVVLYVGRLDVRKGLRELVEAIGELRQGHPGLRCYFVGDGPDRPVLEEAITRLKLDDIIRFVAPQPTERVALWMSASDLVTLPSYKEGCPNVVVEALASGRPVVASNVGGIPELMDEKSGSLVAPIDAHALAVGLREVLNQEWTAEELAGRHRRSWKDASLELEMVLNRVVPA